MKPFSTRATTPRSQATIFPVKVPGAAGASHSALLYGGADDNTIGSGPAPAVIDAPVNSAVAAPAVNVSVDWNSRVWVDAPTVVTHGARWLAVPAPGPSLPADAETNTPAA